MDYGDIGHMDIQTLTLAQVESLDYKSPQMNQWKKNNTTPGMEAALVGNSDSPVSSP